VFLKCSTRRKDGKNIARVGGGEPALWRRQVAQRHVLYLGEINDSQRLAWERAITVFDESTGMTEQMALFPVDRLPQRVALRRCTCAWILCGWNVRGNGARAGWATNCGAPFTR